MIDRTAVIALCAQAWHMSPDEVEVRVADGRIGMRQLMATAWIQVLSAPLTGRELARRVFPMAEKKSRRSQHEKTNTETFEALRAMRKKGTT